MDHLIDDEEIPRHERELTLSTGAILGIFLGLAVLCGGFFGFGYNMGRKSVPAPLTSLDVSPETGTPVTAGNTGLGKPSAGSPADDNAAVPAPTPKPVHRASAPAPVEIDVPDTPAASTNEAEAPKPQPVKPAPVVRQSAPTTPAASSTTAATPAAGAGSFMVQVAAVSHKEDADLLVGALRARGYSVSARPTAGDSFIHVQVGPFHDKKEADAMRQRLLTDGYNAIVK